MFTDLTPESALDTLREPLVAYRDSLDSAVSFADTTMDRLPVCSFTWSTLVRYWAWQEVQARLKDAESWRAKRLLNNGMEILANGHTIRPFKSIDAQPPAPGASLRRRAYYQQVVQGTLDFGEPVYRSSGANLVLDWMVDPETRSTEIALSKPMDTWRYRGMPKLEWRITVQFPDGGGPGALTWEPGSDDDDTFDLNKRIDTSEISVSEEA
jgi:hypothetical protein